MPPDRRTALWVVPVSDLGGVARHVLDVVRVGIPGWRLVVLCPPGPLASAIGDAGGAVLTSEFGPEAGFRASVSSLRHTVHKLRPGVVHSHLSYADIVVAAATPRGVGLVTTEHGIAADDVVYHRSTAEARVMAGVHRARLRRFDRVIGVSRATRDAMHAKWRPRQQVVVLPNGIDPPESPPSPSRGLRILSLARLAPEKRLDDLVCSFARVAMTHPEATLTIAGIGELDGALRNQVGQLGLSDRVVFPGHVEAHSAMAQADVVAQLSVWENCSYTLLDAAAHGLGVVASPVGGNPELLPPHCFADPADHNAVAAHLVAQGCALEARPQLPSSWPTIGTMTEGIARVYEGIAR